MEQVVEATQQTDTNQMLSEKLERLTPSARKMERGREIISKIDPVKFKELTGRDLFKK